MLCVEILYHALQILSSDEQDSEELKKGILSSIAYFLPNSRVGFILIIIKHLLAFRLQFFNGQLQFGYYFW